MKIAIGCDPNAETFKKEMMEYIVELGHEVKGAYAANVWNVYSAKRACLSNNCNIITLGSQVTGNMLGKELIKAYLESTYVENERSGKKVRAYLEYEMKHFK